MTEISPPQAIPGARSLFSLNPGLAHLNHGSLGAVPLPVQHVRRLLMDKAESDPRAFAHQVTDRLAQARQDISPMIGADAALTSFVPNTTTGVAVALNSLDLGSGDEILTTDHGYPSIDFNIAAQAAAKGVVHKIVQVPLTPGDGELIDTVLGGVTERTKLVIVDQITSATARLFPVAELTSRLRSRGVPVLVDGAHVPGHLSVDVSAIGADFWIGNIHKWAFAPRGTAVLAVAPQWRERMRPLTSSYGYVNGFPESVEFHGTDGYTGWIAAPAGVDFLNDLGAQRVRAHNAQLARYGQTVIAKALNVELPDPDESPLGMRLIPLPAGVADTPESAQSLWSAIRAELATEVAVNAWNGRGLLRVAAQIYNTPGQYEHLADGLPGLLSR